MIFWRFSEHSENYPSRKLLKTMFLNLLDKPIDPEDHVLGSLLEVVFLRREPVHKLPRDPKLLILETGLAIILVIELYKFIRFIAS